VREGADPRLGKRGSVQRRILAVLLLEEGESFRSPGWDGRVDEEPPDSSRAPKVRQDGATAAPDHTARTDNHPITDGPGYLSGGQHRQPTCCATRSCLREDRESLVDGDAERATGRGCNEARPFGGGRMMADTVGGSVVDAA